MSDGADPTGRRAALRHVVGALSRIEHSANAQLAREYLRVREVVERASVFTRTNDAYAVESLSRHLGKRFAAATREDLMAWVVELESRLAANSVTTRKASVRRFYKYVADPEGYLDSRLHRSIQPLPCARWLSLDGGAPRRGFGAVLTEGDVAQLVAACKRPRDRALVATLYETGARLGELLSLDVGNVQFDAYGAVVFITASKTYARRVRVVAAAPLLRLHLAEHADARPASPLWYATPSVPGRAVARLPRGTVSGLMRRIARAAGVQKAVNPHAFRHARATVLAGILTESELRQTMGWSRGSRMPSIYVHLSGGEAEAKLLAHHGLKRSPERFLCFTSRESESESETSLDSLVS